jgi:hypothetical protein
MTACFALAFLLIVTLLLLIPSLLLFISYTASRILSWYSSAALSSASPSVMTLVIQSVS